MNHPRRSETGARHETFFSCNPAAACRCHDLEPPRSRNRLCPNAIRSSGGRPNSLFCSRRTDHWSTPRASSSHSSRLFSPERGCQANRSARLSFWRRKDRECAHKGKTGSNQQGSRRLGSRRENQSGRGIKAAAGHVSSIGNLFTPSQPDPPAQLPLRRGGPCHFGTHSRLCFTHTTAGMRVILTRHAM